MSDEVIAVSYEDLMNYGCPYCGCDSSSLIYKFDSCHFLRCANPECQEVIISLGEGVTESPIGINGYFPRIQKHPKYGIPCWSWSENEDK
jgi:hypothetical protein